MKRILKNLLDNLYYFRNQVVMKTGQKKRGTLPDKIAFRVILSCILFTPQIRAQQVRIFNTENSGLRDNYVTSIAIDNQGNKWFGMYHGEAVKFDNVNWTVYDSSITGIPENYTITSVAIDAMDNKWFGACHTFIADGGGGGGLVKFDNTKWTIYNTSNSGLPNNTVWEITIDSLGNKWIGTGFGGVAKFDDNIWTVYNRSNSGLPDDHVWEITIDAFGNKWFATDLSTVSKFDNTSWTGYNYLNSTLLPYDNNVSSIAIDDKGNKWFGIAVSWDTGADGGLAVYDDENWSFYNSTNSGLIYSSVYSIAIDGQGNKWFGTANWTDAALVKFDGSVWTVYDSTNSGLPNDCIYSIVIDAQGNKWLGTANSGVVVFNENGISDDLSNKHSISKINNLSSKAVDFITYPNPAKDIISIKGIQSGTFEIFNSAGMIIKYSGEQGTLSNIDISDLPEGIYTIKVTTRNQVVADSFIKKN